MKRMAKNIKTMEKALKGPNFKQAIDSHDFFYCRNCMNFKKLAEMTQDKARGNCYFCKKCTVLYKSRRLAIKRANKAPGRYFECENDLCGHVWAKTTQPNRENPKIRKNCKKCGQNGLQYKVMDV